MLPTQSHMLILKEKKIPCFLACFVISHERDTAVLSIPRDASGLGIAPIFQALATKKMETSFFQGVTQNRQGIKCTSYSWGDFNT